jgi:hypothetical protein
LDAPAERQGWQLTTKMQLKTRAASARHAALALLLLTTRAAAGTAW